MELILKQPKDKPPFLGIVFTNEFEGASINKSQVNNYRTHLYKVTMEPIGDKLNITIKDDGMGFKYIYEHLEYDHEKLSRFLYNTRQTPIFNFGHVILKGDDYKVLRTTANSALHVLKVNELKFVFEE